MAKHTLLNGPVDTLIKEYTSLVKKKSGLCIDQVILFGSYAQGKQKPYSDIDICVVSKDFDEKNHWDQEMQLRYLTSQVDSMISPVGYHPDDLENPYDSLAVEIKRHGITIS